MADVELTLDLVYGYLVEKGGKVRNRDAVRHFKSFLTDPVHKDENRRKFTSFINTIATTKTEGDEKVVILKSKYQTTPTTPPASPLTSKMTSTTSLSSLLYSPQMDPRNSLGIPLSPSTLFSPLLTSPSPRQPPPYRPPPPPVYASTSSLDTMSLGSMSSLSDCTTPQAPPRRRDSEKSRTAVLLSAGGREDVVTPKKEDNMESVSGGGDEKISVKERTQKFNRLASVEDELSPRQLKSPEKEKQKSTWGNDENDEGSLVPIEPKKCMEWFVTASKGDYQELIKLANKEPRLVNRKDPFTAYTVLHWGAKYGNAEIIKIFAGKYKVDVNGKTNGGYTPLHISAQFGHREVFKLLIEVYKADPKIRDYSGRMADHYLIEKVSKQGGTGITLRKLKGRKKQSEKDLGFLRIGSLNVRVKKTTEAFSNFLGVGAGSVSSINPMDTTQHEKVHKAWGSADNVNKDSTMSAPKSSVPKKKSKRGSYESGRNSIPSTPKTPTRSFNALNGNESDSDTAAGFDSNWKN